jgi:hypothetical protein
LPFPALGKRSALRVRSYPFSTKDERAAHEAARNDTKFALLSSCHFRVISWTAFLTRRGGVRFGGFARATKSFILHAFAAVARAKT